MAASTPLREFVRAHADNRPGVYRMLDGDTRVLYVGKSVKLRTRLLSYFRAGPGEKAHDLMRETASIRWDYIPNEFGSLVREMKLIQRWRPRFNVQHKRKRPWVFVRITREKAPRVLPVRRVVEDASLYYGPFPAGLDLADAVRDLNQALGLRDCPSATSIHFADQEDLFGVDRAPACVRAELGSCLAPCAAVTSSARYQERLARARAFLEGRGVGPITRLEDAMREAAGGLNFEYAARLRDRAQRLREFQEHLAAFRGQVDSLSFVYRVPGWDGDDRLYLIRKGRVRAQLPWRAGARDRRRAARQVRQVFRGPDLSPAALEPEAAAEVLLVARWFRMHPAERARTIRWRRWLEEEPAPTSGPPPPADDPVELALAHGLDG